MGVGESKSTQRRRGSEMGVKRTEGDGTEGCRNTHRRRGRGGEVKRMGGNGCRRGVGALIDLEVGRGGVVKRTVGDGSGEESEHSPTSW